MPNALSITPYVQTWLCSARHIRVLHVFDTACNLVDENSEVISLVTPGIGNGPFNLVVPQVRFSDYVTPADPIVVDQGLLAVGSLEVATSSAACWNPRPPWEALHKNRTRLRSSIRPLLTALREAAPSGSLADLIVNLPPPASEIEAEMLDAARDPATKLVMGLVRGDHSACPASVTCLAGLGGGLTPAGDDWIAGCVLGAWAGLPAPGARKAASWAANVAARNTTVLSAAWLRAAAQGECSAPWHLLFDSMLSENKLSISEAAGAIIRQGHTSGADALAGFAAVLMIQLYPPQAVASSQNPTIMSRIACPDGAPRKRPQGRNLSEAGHALQS